MSKLKLRVHELAFFAAVTAGHAQAANPVLGEVRLEPASRVEKDAGVWLDGQYMGYLKELDGRNTLMVVPGEHQVLIKLVGYEDLAASIVVEPGEQEKYAVAMQPRDDALYPERAQTAKLRIAVEPKRAAVFVNGAYAGPAGRFDSHRGMRLAAGVYQLRITLPGYQAFETQMTLLADQDYEIKTELTRGSISEQSEDLIIERRPGS